MDVFFTTAEVAKTAGVSRQTLGVWASKGVLKPSVRSARGTGTRRLYSMKDLVAAAIAKTCFQKLRMSSKQVAEVVRLVSEASFEELKKSVFVMYEDTRVVQDEWIRLGCEEYGIDYDPAEDDYLDHIKRKGLKGFLAFEALDKHLMREPEFAGRSDADLERRRERLQMVLQAGIAKFEYRMEHFTYELVSDAKKLKEMLDSGRVKEFHPLAYQVEGSLAIARRMMLQHEQPS